MSHVRLGLRGGWRRWEFDQRINISIQSVHNGDDLRVSDRGCKLADVGAALRFMVFTRLRETASQRAEPAASSNRGSIRGLTL